MAHALFLQPEYRWISAQCEVFKNLNARAGDKLAVENDRFVLSPGGFSQAFTRLYRNCLKGGYNRDAVVAHFEKIAGKVDAFVQNLRAHPDYLALPETRNFAKNLCLLRTGASDVEFSYRDRWAINDQTPSKLSAVFNRLHQVSHPLNRQLGLEEDFLSPVPFRMPPDQTVEQTVALAKKSLVSTADKVKAIALFVLFLLLLPFTFLLCLGKWTLWNPIEFVIRGKITTTDPYDWFTINGCRLDTINRQKDWQVRGHAGQLLRTPTITDQHIEGWRQIASLKKDTIKEVDLGLASTQQERFLFGLYFIALPTLLKLISYLSAIPSCKRVEIPRNLCLDPDIFPQVRDHYLAVDEALRKAGFQKHETRKGVYIRC